MFKYEANPRQNSHRLNSNVPLFSFPHLCQIAGRRGLSISNGAADNGQVVSDIDGGQRGVIVGTQPIHDAGKSRINDALALQGERFAVYV